MSLGSSKMSLIRTISSVWDEQRRFIFSPLVRMFLLLIAGLLLPQNVVLAQLNCPVPPLGGTGTIVVGMFWDTSESTGGGGCTAGSVLPGKSCAARCLLGYELAGTNTIPAQRGPMTTNDCDGNTGQSLALVTPCVPVYCELPAIAGGANIVVTQGGGLRRQLWTWNANSQT